MVKPALKNWVLAALLLATLASFGQQAGGNVSGWFDVGEYVYNNSNTNPNDLNFHLLQYDSGYYWLDMGGVAQPFNVFSAGNVFDLTHELWSAVPSPAGYSIIPLTFRDPFVWDSLRFNYFYLRGDTDTSVTDTLFIYYYSNFDENDTQLVFSRLVVNSNDTCGFSKPHPINYNELSGKYFRKDTVLLKHNDTASIHAGNTYKTDVTKTFSGKPHAKQNFHGLFGYSVTFKPGALTVQSDTLFDIRYNSAKANVFGLYVIDVFENPFGMGLLNYYFLHKRFSQNSFFLYKENRYGGTHNGQHGFYPGIFTPNSQSTVTNQFLHGAAFITATSTVSAKEINPHAVKLYPNPALPGEIITIETGDELPTRATITITDMLGRQVLSEAVANNYTIPAPLTEGIYNVVITAKDNSSSCSTKLIVINR